MSSRRISLPRAQWRAASSREAPSGGGCLTHRVRVARERDEAAGRKFSCSHRHGVAERFFPGRNRSASPYRFELEIDPEVWFLEDEGFALAVFHSHPSSPPRPSRTDVENIGLWEGRPYVILSLRTGELSAWTIADGSVDSLPLS